MNQYPQVIEAVDALRMGKVILCPSDTVASISCDACNEAAIERVFEIKQRPPNKSLIVLVSSYTMLEAYVPDIPEAAYQLLEATNAPTTIIYPNVRNLPDSVRASDGSVGFRLVTGGFIKSLIDRFRKPLVSTSANISGQPTPIMVADTDSAISAEVDLVIDLPEYLSKPSSIIKFEKDATFKIIRK